MAVLLSPVGGVAAQFFDNNGNPLTGGKLYSYSAGTTTPAATYTSSLGTTAHPNPIVLDAGGRVPGGEIWLTDGVIYKFVLQTSTNVLIATYDNIVGINSNFVNYTASQEIQTATAGQTVFNLATTQYQPGTNSLSVFVDGVNQYGPGAQYAYLETDSDTVTFVTGLHVGASVKFTTTTQTTGNATDASVVTYDPPFANSVVTDVEAKLAQYVSVKDFGAVGDGVTDDTAAFQDAVTYCAANNVGLNIPSGTFVLQAGGAINFAAQGLNIIGDGQPTLQFVGTGNGFYCSGGPDNGSYVENMRVENLLIVGGPNVTNGCYLSGVVRSIFKNIEVKECNSRAFVIRFGVSNLYENFKYSASGHTTTPASQGVYITNAGAGYYTADCTFINLISEDFPTTGCYLEDASGCTFVGGTFEGCATGLVVGVDSKRNKFDSVWFEANTAKDLEDAGRLSVYANCNFISAGSSGTIVVSTGQGAMFVGGYIRTADLQSGSSAFFVGCGFDENLSNTLGITGSGTYKAIGLLKIDTNYDVVGEMPDVFVQGTYTATATGMTTAPTGTVTYNKSGLAVTLNIPAISGTSNSTQFTLTGMPTDIRPSATRYAVTSVVDNGTNYFGVAEIATTGVIQLYATPTFTPFTASGTKGTTAFSVSYLV